MATNGKKLVKSKSGYRMVTVDESLASPFTIGEPEWIADSSCTNCQNAECHVKLDFWTRKHHCRRCGKCFCDKCCNVRVALPRMCFIDPVRHCQVCALVSRRENDFFDKHLKILIEGGEFRLFTDPGLEGSNSFSLPGESFSCCLTADHRFLKFEGDIEGQDDIEVRKIRSVQVAEHEQDEGGNISGKGIAIQYERSTEVLILKMMVEEKSERRQQSMCWVGAMRKAYKLLQESQLSNSLYG